MVSRARHWRRSPRRCDLILLSLPDGKAVAAVIAELEPHLRAGQCVVDTSTSSVAADPRDRRTADRARDWLRRCAGRPHTRGRRARRTVDHGRRHRRGVRPCPADSGDDGHRRDPLRPDRLRPGGEDPQQHAGVPEHRALAEAIAIGRRNGVPPEVLLPTIAKGSGDSFVLRSHGMKSMLPRDFPERAFSTRYAIKDLSYALEMAAASGLAVPGAELTMQRLKASEQAGNGEKYHPAVLSVIDPP